MDWEIYDHFRDMLILDPLDADEHKLSRGVREVLKKILEDYDEEELLNG